MQDEAWMNEKAGNPFAERPRDSTAIEVELLSMRRTAVLKGKPERVRQINEALEALGRSRQGYCSIT